MSKTPGDAVPKRLNAVQKRALAQSAVHRFVQQYRRKAQKRAEPNDRKYDRKIEKTVKRMKPDRLDALLRDRED